MTFLVLGLVVGGALILVSLAIPRVAADAAGRKAEEVRRARPWLRAAGIVVAVLGVLPASFRVVPGGTVGVQILFGRIDERP